MFLFFYSLTCKFSELSILIKVSLRIEPRRYSIIQLWLTLIYLVVFIENLIPSVAQQVIDECCHVGNGDLVVAIDIGIG